MAIFSHCLQCCLLSMVTDEGDDTVQKSQPIYIIIWIMCVPTFPTHLQTLVKLSEVLFKYRILELIPVNALHVVISQGSICLEIPNFPGLIGSQSACPAPVARIWDPILPYIIYFPLLTICITWLPSILVSSSHVTIYPSYISTTTASIALQQACYCSSTQ